MFECCSSRETEPLGAVGEMGGVGLVSRGHPDISLSVPGALRQTQPRLSLELG